MGILVKDKETDATSKTILDVGCLGLSHAIESDACHLSPKCQLTKILRQRTFLAESARTLVAEMVKHHVVCKIVRVSRSYPSVTRSPLTIISSIAESPVKPYAYVVASKSSSLQLINGT